MFDFNTLFPSSNIKVQKEKADIIIRSWKAEHEKELKKYYTDKKFKCEYEE